MRTGGLVEKIVILFFAINLRLIVYMVLLKYKHQTTGSKMNTNYHTVKIDNKRVRLTSMECSVYNAVKTLSEYEECYALHPEDIMHETGISMKQLRGVISSLVKKELAYVDELICGRGDWVILWEPKEENEEEADKEELRIEEPTKEEVSEDNIKFCITALLEVRWPRKPITSKDEFKKALYEETMPMCEVMFGLISLPVPSPSELDKLWCREFAYLYKTEGLYIVE